MTETIHSERVPVLYEDGYIICYEQWGEYAVISAWKDSMVCGIDYLDAHLCNSAKQFYNFYREGVHKDIVEAVIAQAIYVRDNENVRSSDSTHLCV